MAAVRAGSARTTAATGTVLFRGLSAGPTAGYAHVYGIMRDNRLLVLPRMKWTRKFRAFDESRKLQSPDQDDVQNESLDA